MSGIQQGFMSFRSTGPTGYKYVAVNSNFSNPVFGGTTLAGSTALPTQPTSVYTQGFIVTVADGNFIANARDYSTDNGATWTAFSTSAQTDVTLPYGLNTVAAYSPTAKRFLRWFHVYDPKSAAYYANISLLTSAGAASSGTSFIYYASLYPKTTMWSPALDAFYLTNFSTSATTTRYISSSGTGGTNVTMAGNGNYKAGISNDGYLLNAFFTGSVMELRKYTSVDLSTYTNYGTISYAGSGYSTQSPFTWCPVNNKYYICASSGGAVIVATSTSSAPQTFSNLSSTTITNSGIATITIFEESDGTLWLNGLGVFYDPKAGQVTNPYTYKSTDGGATFTSTISRLAPSKNFAYP
jgi:hypothetical protein